MLVRRYISAAAVSALALGYAASASADTVVSLIADNGDGLGGINVGTVTVEENGGSFDVTYATLGNWVIVETHTHVDTANDCANVPQTGSGNPKVGRFDYSASYDLASAPTSSTTTIPDSVISGDSDSTICIAAHAVVFDPTADADLQVAFDLSEETAWGNGDLSADGAGFLGRNWATYFTADSTELLVTP